MRTLTATLEAAQTSASARPYVRATFADYHGEVSRARFQRYYNGSEGDYFGAVTVAGDGSLVRARIDPATKVLYTQRVATPGPSSTYSSWSSIATVSASGAVALAASSTTVYLFYVETDTVTLKVRTSTDNGATFGSAASVATAAGAVTYLAAAVATGGDVALFWNAGANVWSSRYNAVAWSTPAAWTNTVDSLTGLACTYRGDWCVVVTGTESASLDAKVWTCVFGDDSVMPADTWSNLKELTTATATTDVSFHAPAVAFQEHWRLFFVEEYAGTASYARLQASTMSNLLNFDENLWREPFALDYESDYGVATAVSAGRVWLSSPAGVWSAAVPSWSELEVTADVVEAEVVQDEYEGRARLVLRNDPAGHEAAGRYASYGSAGLVALQRGARLRLSPGYYTTAGTEASTGPTFWVESVEQTTGPSPALIVQARDLWWLLAQWRARRQFFWPSGTQTVASIIEYVCARAGVAYATVSSSPALGTLTPAFTIHPNEDGRTAVRRLLALVEDEAVARTSLRGVYPDPADAPVYEYGDGHAIVSARYREHTSEVNRARVVGAGAFSEGFDFAESTAVGERIGLVSDINLTTDTLTDERAAVELRRTAIRSRDDEITVFGVNCAQELYDVVSVTDAQAGLSSAPRRVLGLVWRYSTGNQRARPRYEMTLRLGRP